MANEELSWFRIVGYTIIAFVGLGVIGAAIAFGTIIGIPVFIVFVIYEINRQSNKPDDLE